MNIHDNHRSTSNTYDDDELSEGELESLDETDDDDNNNATKMMDQSKNVSQSWTHMLTEQNLSSIMSNALADNTQIIHIDDPIAQQSTNPLTYVFPSGTNVEGYFQRKKGISKRNKTKCNAHKRNLKKLAQLLHNETNTNFLQAIIDIIGCQRAFQYAQEAIKLYKTNDSSIKKTVNGQKRTLGGAFFKMLINDENNQYVNNNEREEIRKQNQEIQKHMKKKKNKDK